MYPSAGRGAPLPVDTSAGRGVRNDRVLPETRVLAAIIDPFLVAAWVILYFFPDRTKELFAWGIAPSMTSFMLGSAYIGGAYFFIRAFTAPRWHEIALGFLPVAVFASCMGIATALHWDKFTHGTLSFDAWVILYAVTPFLVFGVWLRNRMTDPGKSDPRDVLLPRPLRWGVGAVGLGNVLVALLLFAQPQLMLGLWPWKLTPLTARVLGGVFALPGVVGLGMAVDPRWSAARITLQSQAVALAFILLGAARAWADFNPANPLTWVFVGSLGALFVGSIALHVALERVVAGVSSVGGR